MIVPTGHLRPPSNQSSETCSPRNFVGALPRTSAARRGESGLNLLGLGERLAGDLDASRRVFLASIAHDTAVNAAHIASLDGRYMAQCPAAFKSRRSGRSSTVRSGQMANHVPERTRAVAKMSMVSDLGKLVFYPVTVPKW
jgi:hypothetical protein